MWNHYASLAFQIPHTPHKVKDVSVKTGLLWEVSKGKCEYIFGIYLLYSDVTLSTSLFAQSLSFFGHNNKLCKCLLLFIEVGLYFHLLKETFTQKWTYGTYTKLIFESRKFLPSNN